MIGNRSGLTFFDAEPLFTAFATLRLLLVVSFDLTLATIPELGHTICVEELYFCHSWLSGMGNESRTLESIMLSWALTFLVLALIAALFGFGGIAAGAASIAKILFFLFLVLFVVSLIANVTRGRNVV